MKALKPKDPLIALLLTVLIPGLGHVYAGRRKAGIKFFCLLVLLPLALVCYAALPFTRFNWGIGYCILAIFLFLAGLSIFVLFDVYQCAKSFNRRHNVKTNTSKAGKFWLIVYIVFFMFVFNPRPFVFCGIIKPFKIPTGAMAPTLIPADMLFVNKAIYKFSEPQRGDVIVFKYPDDPSLFFIKRIAGLPGEKLEIRDGQLVINGKIVKSIAPGGGYLNAGGYGQEGQVIEIPKENYFVLGDNTLNSKDSRYWGFVPKENLIGKAYKIYYPFDRSGPIE